MNETRKMQNEIIVALAKDVLGIIAQFMLRHSITTKATAGTK